MASDLTVFLPNQPGSLAKLGIALGQAGINIQGICGSAGNGQGMVHVLVEDAAAARRALQAGGMEVRGERPVLLSKLPDRPGELGKFCQRIADQGVNVELLYLTTDGQVVLGADNLERARAAL